MDAYSRIRSTKYFIIEIRKKIIGYKNEVRADSNEKCISVLGGLARVEAEVVVEERSHMSDTGKVHPLLLRRLVHLSQYIAFVCFLS